jgi:hypothetical protein
MWPIWPSSGVKLCSGKTAAIYCGATACIVPQIIVWLLVFVLTVLAVLCFLFFVTCFIIECLLGWIGSSFKCDFVAICCFLLVLSRISDCGCRCMCHSFVICLYSYVVSPVCSDAFLSYTFLRLSLR